MRPRQIVAVELPQQIDGPPLRIAHVEAHHAIAARLGDVQMPAGNRQARRSAVARLHLRQIGAHLEAADRRHRLALAGQNVGKPIHHHAHPAPVADVHLSLRVDRHGIIRMVSPSVARLGYSVEELVGLDTRVFASDPSQRARINELLIETTPGGEFELLLHAKNGTPVPISVNARVMTDADGGFAGIEGVLRDISERKRVEAHFSLRAKVDATEALYRRLVEGGRAA